MIFENAGGGILSGLMFDVILGEKSNGIVPEIKSSSPKQSFCDPIGSSCQRRLIWLEDFPNTIIILKLAHNLFMSNRILRDVAKAI